MSDIVINLAVPDASASVASSVASTPNPSPRAGSSGDDHQAAKCDLCGFLVLKWKSYVVKECKHELCLECLVPSNKMGQSGTELILECPCCGIGGSVQTNGTLLKLPEPTERVLKLQRLYDSRRRPPLPEPFASLEADPGFIRREIRSEVPAITTDSLSIYSVLITRSRATPRFDRWSVEAPGHNPAISGMGRTLDEAWWQFRREARSIHLCKSCGTTYRGSQCTLCATRALGNPVVKCNICMDTTPFIYKLNCNHEYCRPCLIKARDSHATRRAMCPSCRRDIVLIKGWREPAPGCNCGRHHHHSDSESDGDDDEEEGN
jgi:hypothetical protein